MNYTGRPSISGCRPVLSLYPTHRFCQYLLLIFITFTNSFLFNRAFSTNSRRALSHAAGVQRKVNRPANGSPFGGAGERSETERARLLTENHRHSDSIALTKSLPIAAQRLFPAGLALSVIASQCHLSQRERLWQAGRRKKSPFWSWHSRRGFSFALVRAMNYIASIFCTFIICHSPQKSSTAQKVYSHSSLGISCIFLTKRVV